MTHDIPVEVQTLTSSHTPPARPVLPCSYEAYKKAARREVAAIRRGWVGTREAFDSTAAGLHANSKFKVGSRGDLKGTTLDFHGLRQLGAWAVGGHVSLSC